jgi:predicted deacetylase
MPDGNQQAWSRTYVPEIHDVHPGMLRELDAMTGVMPAAARDVAAILVVPDWMGAAPIAADRNFIAAVSALPGEKVLHGFTHSLGPDFWNWLFYGHDNRSEFARLGRHEAAGRIASGLKAFADAFGKLPRWFCAPRWQQSAAATEALKAAGIGAWMTGRGFSAADGRRADLPALNFDEGERKLRNAILHRLREGRISRLLAAGRPFRVALHPADVGDPVAWAQVTNLFARLAAEGWRPVSTDAALARLSQEGGRP